MFEEFKKVVTEECKMIDIELMDLGIEVKQDEDENFISLYAYAKRVPEMLKMKICEPVDNFIDCGTKMSKYEEEEMMHITPFFFSWQQGTRFWRSAFSQI